MSEIKTIFVGLSGGVDSSVAALRLKKSGHNVVGVFIKTWQPDFIRCNWEKERLDAMRVAATLDIPFLTCDAETAYKKGVADYLIREYEAGRTPNPDVMCNKQVKFDAFLSFAKEQGADMIATGHYAQIEQRDGRFLLKRGADKEKDQSYFLWMLTSSHLPSVAFPVGDSLKKNVREEAKAANLPTHKKPDSQGICFLGEVDMKQFLSHYVDTQEGSVLDEEGAPIGTHSGSLFFTIGQRHGFHVQRKSLATVPFYVKEKSLKENTITVTSKQPTVSSQNITINGVNRIGEKWNNRQLLAQFRYRQKPIAVHIESESSDSATLHVLEETDAPSTGQSCVLYDGDICVGGGIIE